MAVALDLVDVSNALAFNLYRNELGRLGKAKEVEDLAKAIRAIGYFQALANVHGSAEAVAYRKKTGKV